MTLEQIDSLFSGPKVLIHATSDELQQMQDQDIKEVMTEEHVEYSSVPDAAKATAGPAIQPA